MANSRGSLGQYQRAAQGATISSERVAMEADQRRNAARKMDSLIHHLPADYRFYRVAAPPDGRLLVDQDIREDQDTAFHWPRILTHILEEVAMVHCNDFAVMGRFFWTLAYERPANLSHLFPGVYDSGPQLIWNLYQFGERDAHEYMSKRPVIRDRMLFIQQAVNIFDDEPCIPIYTSNHPDFSPRPSDGCGFNSMERYMPARTNKDTHGIFVDTIHGKLYAMTVKDFHEGLKLSCDPDKGVPVFALGPEHPENNAMMHARAITNADPAKGLAEKMLELAEPNIAEDAIIPFHQARSYTWGVLRTGESPP